jgi:hypothetical protein
MWMARIFVSLVGGLYVLLGLYCSLLPARASKTVGFQLLPGSGQSEFVTVYGGLEVGMGLIFLWPLIRPGETEFAIRACLMIHGCLVLFRGIGFAMFRELEPITYKLAIGEWVIFLASAFLWWRLGKS